MKIISTLNYSDGPLTRALKVTHNAPRALRLSALVFLGSAFGASWRPAIAQDARSIEHREFIGRWIRSQGPPPSVTPDFGPYFGMVVVDPFTRRSGWAIGYDTSRGAETDARDACRRVATAAGAPVDRPEFCSWVFPIATRPLFDDCIAIVEAPREVFIRKYATAWHARQVAESACTAKVGTCRYHYTVCASGDRHVGR